ncbi:hypothetical protein SAMD00023353_4900520 [Rosellinia necatrix]|uniref:Family c-likeg-protein-coupled receptor protein n=1 Tax=Rosellinia necatrix TaxID=77044 RepID=A0A1W2TPP2_ROSNE|nr:hypothetical protein SAMD00023353_4900520 [Rosellinia necatrix]
MSKMPPSQPVFGPPYASPNAGLGGLPEVIPDIPISAVFLALYLGFAVTNMTILQVNLRRGHKFVISGALFGFSMSRIVTFVLRMAWATHQHNVRLALAANVFVNAGVLVAYVVNLVFAQRILRARQPALGWGRALGAALRAAYAGVGAALVLVIYAAVQGAYTRDAPLLRAVRSIQLAASTYLLVFSTLPLLLLAAAHFGLPRAADAEAFGRGSMRAKALINLASTCLCVLAAGFKAGTAWERPRPAADPAWYHGRPAFYVLGFVPELLVLALLTFSRVDRRFHVPDGSSRPGDYSRQASEATTMEKPEADGSVGTQEV